MTERQPKRANPTHASSRHPHQTAPHSPQAVSIVKLQSVIGNQAVQRVFLGSLLLASSAVAATLSKRVLEFVEQGQTRLTADYVNPILADISGSSELQSAYQKAIGEIQMADPEAQQGVIDRHASAIMRQLENQFVNDPKASTLDLLSPEDRKKYRDFKWGEFDFPGDKAGSPRKGANEGRAVGMANAMDDLFPEKRVNIRTEKQPHGIVTKSEFKSSATLREFIKSELVPVPDEPGEKLNAAAAEAFVRMREAAAEDGITLKLKDSHRKPEVSEARAEKAGNKSAIADFSAHNLGLAIDLKMSHGKQRFKEVRTTPMQNVVDMRKSAVHKWLFLNADSFGWYPYQNEPWHWEYNPPGFKEQFDARAAGYWLGQELLKWLED